MFFSYTSDFVYHSNNVHYNRTLYAVTYTVTHISYIMQESISIDVMIPTHENFYQQPHWRHLGQEDTKVRYKSGGGSDYVRHGLQPKDLL